MVGKPTSLLRVDRLLSSKLDERYQSLIKIYSALRIVCGGPRICKASLGHVRLIKAVLLVLRIIKITVRSQLQLLTVDFIYK